MNKRELSAVNDKITNGELYFYPGVPVEEHLKKGFGYRAFNLCLSNF